MDVLRMRDAVFSREDLTVGPLTLQLADAQRRALAFDSPRGAAAAALLACGGARATSGQVFIAEFDPRLQPVQCKRLAGYVPHELVTSEFASFEQYVEYRAALWSLDAGAARAYARDLLNELRDLHESFAYALIGALLSKPQLLVLDRPPVAHAATIHSVGAHCAIFSTHLSEREAAAFT